MKRGMVALAVLWTLVPAGAAGVENIPGFTTNLKLAQKVAKEKNLPIYIHFTTDWCPYCRKMENENYKTAEGQEALKEYVPVLLNCTKGARNAAAYDKLREQYGGTGYPFIVLVTPTGGALDTMGGYCPTPTFKRFLEGGQTKFGQYKEFKEYEAKADRKAEEYNVKAVAFYANWGEWSEAGKAAGALKAMKKGEPTLIAYVEFKAALEKGSLANAKRAQEELAKLDAENASGYLEKAVADRAEFDYGRVLKAKPSKRVAKAELQRILKTMTDLEAKAEKIHQPMRFYWALSVYQSVLGDRTSAIATLEKLRPLCNERQQRLVDGKLIELKGGK